MNKTAKSLIMTTVGAFFFSSAVSLFLSPNQMASGGVSGISIVLSHLLPLSTGTFYMLLNIPIVVVGIWKLGPKTMTLTAYSVMAISVLTNILEAFGPVTQDKILAAVMGGAIQGIGLGLTFLAGATTGGTDIIIKLMRRRYQHIKTGVLFWTLDLIVVVSTGIVFRNIELALYAVLTIVVSAAIMDKLLYGADEARMIYIITDNSENITRRLIKDLEVGCTKLDGRGGYTDSNKDVIVCVVHKKVAPEVHNIVKEEDLNAFMIVSSANEIFGQGYKDMRAESL